MADINDLIDEQAHISEEEDGTTVINATDTPADSDTLGFPNLFVAYYTALTGNEFDRSITPKEDYATLQNLFEQHPELGITPPVTYYEPINDTIVFTDIEQGLIVIDLAALKEALGEDMPSTGLIASGLSNLLTNTLDGYRELLSNNGITE